MEANNFMKAINSDHYREAKIQQMIAGEINRLDFALTNDEVKRIYEARCLPKNKRCKTDNGE